MKHKVSELTGGLLDAAVCFADGRKFQLRQIDGRTYCSRWEEADYGFVTSSMAWEWFSYQPSTSWATGGPIIEREGIAIAPYEHGIGEPSMWVAWVEERQHQATFDSYFERGIFDDNSRGHTPLIAAMRAYVCSKLGEEVELP